MEVNASSSSNALKPSSHSTLQTISHKVHSPSSSNALKTPSSQTIQRNSHVKNPNEYVSKILFVIKPITIDAKWIPFPTSEYTTEKFALVVICSNPLHFKVIRLSYTKPSDMPKEKVDYDYYNIELFSSTTWQWREFQNIQLPSYVYPVSDEIVTSGGIVYFLLSYHTILQFDIYSEEHILIVAPFTINDFKPYASRLIKFHGKLGYFSVSGEHLWAIWVFIHNQLGKVDVSTYNEES
uniref:F-box associated domain-containing protein n=1 Tax=Lactuca sativa TaxID=4236 RepID=A0A9R1V0Q9_LACSA|nr:hypothetical protein LSAT_V11C700348430 [Lactuca sativa]